MPTKEDNRGGLLGKAKRALAGRGEKIKEAEKKASGTKRKPVKKKKSTDSAATKANNARIKAKRLAREKKAKERASVKMKKKK